MNHQKILSLANASMLITFLAFFACAILAYGWENQLPLIMATLLHVAQMFLAGFFKVSYVVRLVSQKQLGLEVA